MPYNLEPTVVINSGAKNIAWSDIIKVTTNPEKTLLFKLLKFKLNLPIVKYEFEWNLLLPRCKIFNFEWKSKSAIIKK